MRREFERVSPESVGIPSSAINKLLDQLETDFAEMHGIMIMRFGKVCAEGWWSPYAPGIRHGCQSLTKTYAATAVGLAYTEGLLKLEDRIIDIFSEEAPENPSENLQRLTVRDVLCMGCGMDEMPRPSKDWIRDFLRIPVNHVPGTTFMYNSVGSTLLGAIVRKVTGQGLHEYLKPRLFDKIGIDADNLKWMYMPDGMEVGGGGLFSTTEDNLRLMKLYSQGGIWEGERILAEEYVQKATTVQNDSASEAKVNPPATDNFLGYGFQMWMCKSNKTYRADGAFGQFSIVYPEQDLIISINETAVGAVGAQKTLDTLYEVLLPEIKSDVLEENEAEWAKLKRRMQTLSLPNPRYAPYSQAIKEMNGKNYEVTEGAFTFFPYLFNFMSGEIVSNGISEFSFDFKSNHCVLSILENGKKTLLDVGIDGTRSKNILKSDATATDELLLSGAWVSDQQFSIAARHIETCFEKEVVFHFSEKDVIITEKLANGGMGFFAGRDKEYAAKAIQK